MDDKDKLNEIIDGCKRGDNHAFSQLVDMFSSPCYGYFYRVSGNAEISNDLLSDLFVKLVEKIDTFKDGSFRSWIFTVAANIWRDHLRGVYRQRKLIDKKAELVEEHTLGSVGQVDISDQMQYYLAKLDSDTAELLMMRFYSQMSFKELAEARSEPIGTTLARVHRGLKRLRELMDIKNEKE